MPKEKTKEEKAAEKARQKEKESRAADKTFGLKNKNKSKVVQQQVKQIQSSMKAHAPGQQGRPNDEFAEKKAKDAQNKQAALLAGLFGMATDKKGRTFDPQAKKKAKEKNMEDERSGINVPEEVQQKLAAGIKNAIRMTNPKGTNLSTIGGSAYVRDVLDDKKYEKHLKSITTLYFIRRRKNDFWISEDDAENQNPTIRCQEDVDAENIVDERDMFVQLEERRQQYVGNATLARVDMIYLKKWWMESARLELKRCPDTGRILDETELTERHKKAAALAKKLTGEQLFKKDPTIFKTGADFNISNAAAAAKEGSTTAQQPTPSSDGVDGGVSRPADGDVDEDDDGLERDETMELGNKKWDVVDFSFSDEEADDPSKKESAANSNTAGEQSAGSAGNNNKPEEPEVNEAIFAAAVDDLPDDLDELDDD